MAKAWSEYFQLPELLEYTRRYMLTEEMRELICAHMQLNDGETVLEVGCGTGYLSRYLARGKKNLSVTGIDTDQGFLTAAARFAEQERLHHITFMQADANALPFADDSFDRVVSHTFLTSTMTPQKSLREMHRVVKKGGSISSITPMSVMPSVLEEGCYPADCGYIARYRVLFEKVWKMYGQINPITEYINAVDSGKIPQMFVKEGLKEVSLFPIGYAFSFSDASFCRADREKYIALSYQEESQKFERFIALNQWEMFLSREEVQEYRHLLQEKRTYLQEHLEDNSIFEWNGRANIMVTGKA